MYNVTSDFLNESSKAPNSEETSPKFLLKISFNSLMLDTSPGCIT